MTSCRKYKLRQIAIGNIFQKFVQKKTIKLGTVASFDKSDLFKKINRWLRDNDYPFALTPKKLRNRLLVEDEMPMKEKIYNGYPTIEFDVEKVYDHLIKKGWVKRKCLSIQSTDTEEQQLAKATLIYLKKKFSVWYGVYKTNKKKKDEKEIDSMFDF